MAARRIELSGDSALKKTCRRCGVSRSTAGWAKKSDAADGLQPYCCFCRTRSGGACLGCGVGASSIEDDSVPLCRGCMAEFPPIVARSFASPPTLPGVYIARVFGEVVYVGLASNLARRLQQHSDFGHPGGNAFVGLHVIAGHDVTFEWMVLEKEHMHWAEAAMIAKYRPRYNKTFNVQHFRPIRSLEELQ